MATILIVDDSSFMRKRIAQTLSQAGHEIVGQAGDGLQGFELYKALDPDYVIMDITMRGTDGIVGARMIRDYDADAQVVFISLMTDPDLIARAKELGAVEFIGKDEYDRLRGLIP